MIVGLCGSPGAGKTLAMTAITQYTSQLTGVEILANYPCINSTRFSTFTEISQQAGKIIAWDEIHMTMDSRAFKDRNSLTYTQWLSILRHFSSILFYTAQHISQVDLRLRLLTDYIILCQNSGKKIKLQFIDWQYLKAGRRFTIEPKNAFYKYYDSYAILKPVMMPFIAYKKGRD